MKRLRFIVSSLFPRAPLALPFRRHLLLNRLVFGLWFQARRLAWTTLARIGFNRHVRTLSASGHIESQVIPHNQDQLWRITRHRTERCINVLRTIHTVDPRRARVLAIGPRNEAELMLFWAYGFPKRNLTAIDLFTYTPRIDVMDMHQMSFAADSFDVVYSSYVLRYSPDLKRACAEMLRVVKDGGLIVVAFVNGVGAKTSMVAAPLDGGLSELFACFDGAIATVHWQEEHPAHDGTGNNCTTIFRVRKASSAPA